MHDDLKALLAALNKVVYGQGALFERLLMALLTSGHVLLEGVPGVAKTTAVRAFATALGLEFSRIQFTPDLLPGDLIGLQVWRPNKEDFIIHKGPIFGHIILADEINRAPAKVQSALLEAMAERGVTIAEETLSLPDPFVVLATQNPLEQEGTYQLPEAQLDRFLFKVRVDYPIRAAEKAMLDAALSGELAQPLSPMMTKEQLLKHRAELKKINISAEIRNYLLDLVAVTREPKRYAINQVADLIAYGISPRGLIYLAEAARVAAYLAGREYVTPDDVQKMIYDCWRHRLGLSFTAQAEGVSSDEVLQQIVRLVAVP